MQAAAFLPSLVRDRPITPRRLRRTTGNSSVSSVAHSLRAVVISHALRDECKAPSASADGSVASLTGLVRLVAAGDQAAMADLYDATSSLVYGLALRIVKQPQAAEDVAVEVYSQIWRDAALFDAQRGSASSWIVTVARSRAIDHLRALRREPSTEPVESALQIGGDEPGPEQEVADRERQQLVRQALRRLSAEQRAAIQLAYFEGLSHSEIALRLDVPLGTIKTRIRNGMMQLRGALSGTHEGGSE